MHAVVSSEGIMNTNAQLQNIVDNFVQQLTAVWRQSAIDALGGMGGGQDHAAKKSSKIAASNGHSNGNSNGNGHSSNGHAAAKGAKRDPAAIGALKDKFLSFVNANGGLRIEQINKEMGTSTKELALPIRQLLAEKLIKAKGQKRSTTYFGK